MIKAVVSYDGTAYQGWQKQENALGIQTVIENALEKIHGGRTPIVASGRTDAGVHARGQVFHFQGRKDINYVLALNAILPDDIRILETRAADDDFHARFSAVSKRYDYWMSVAPPDPFTYKYKWYRWKRPDIEAMRQGAEYLLGTHDFTSFSNCHIEPEKSRIKTITRIDILEHGDDIQLIFEGSSFLRYQVRMMTGVLDAVGQGKVRPEEVKKMLEACGPHAVKYNAPARGLFLMEVCYER